MHHPSEMPYRCETCDYRTSSHKDVIDHYYLKHNKSDGLQCPYCLKVIKFVNNSTCQPSSSNIHAYLMHMQRHIVRRDEKLNRCPRCCLWFNQMSSLKAHVDLHSQGFGPREYKLNFKFQLVKYNGTLMVPIKILEIFQIIEILLRFIKFLMILCKSTN